jgi:DNA polymerase III subunit gamma/tau
MADTAAVPEGTPRFLVSARKYRPQTFGDLVAQEHVTATLRNALRLDRLAHAYLFSGPRGVGKTTAARLLAKAINCQTPLAERQDAEPCRTCTSCRAFEEGRDLNVIEIDAASHNKVEDVRNLRENVLIPPQGARRKVYIIDEVHMLSTAAFNALLKTLEEPPAHALFIFATTEPHKVLQTILSRCQRFDFRRIPVADSVELLGEICEAEAITADDASLHLLARKGDGALRDTLSLFDQAVALCGTDLQYADLAEALGVVDRDLYFAVTDRARQRDSAGLLHLVDDVMRRGYDLAEFLAGLTEHLRHLYVGVSTGDAGLIETDAETRARYLAAGSGQSEADLLRAMTVLEEAERGMRQSAQPRLTVELALLRLAHLEPVGNLRTLLAKLERLEEAIRNGEVPLTVAPPPAGPPKAQPAAEATGPAAPRPGAAPTATSEPGPRYDRPADRPPPPEPRGGDDEPPPPPAGPRQPPPAAPPTRERPAGDPATPSFFPPPALQRRRAPQSGEGDRTDASAQAGDGSVGGAPVMAPAGDEHFGVPLGRVRDVWPEMVRLVRDRRPSIAGMLSLATPDGVRNGAVAVAVPDAFTAQMLRHEMDAFTTALGELMSAAPPPLAFVVSTAAAETAAEADPFEMVKRLRHEHPVLRELFDRFGGEIVWT